MMGPATSGIAAGSFGYKLHIELHTGVKASVNHACQTETDDNKLRANAASGLKKKCSPTYQYRTYTFT